MKLKAVINGTAVERETDGSKRLIDFLREDLGLTGTKEGCSEGECGACTVILNGEAVPSCLVLAGQIQGGEVLTIEGLEKMGNWISSKRSLSPMEPSSAVFVHQDS